VGVSASSFLADSAVLRPQYEELADLCRGLGVFLVVGGEGAWPDEPEYGARVRSLRELPDIRDTVCRSRRSPPPRRSRRSDAGRASGGSFTPPSNTRDEED